MGDHKPTCAPTFESWEARVPPSAPPPLSHADVNDMNPPFMPSF